MPISLSRSSAEDFRALLGYSVCVVSGVWCVSVRCVPAIFRVRVCVCCVCARTMPISLSGSSAEDFGALLSYCVSGVWWCLCGVSLPFNFVCVCAVCVCAGTSGFTAETCAFFAYQPIQYMNTS